jgi:hypothetical protein
MRVVGNVYAVETVAATDECLTQDTSRFFFFFQHEAQRTDDGKKRTGSSWPSQSSLEP